MTSVRLGASTTYSPLSNTAARVSRAGPAACQRARTSVRCRAVRCAMRGSRPTPIHSRPSWRSPRASQRRV